MSKCLAAPAFVALTTVASVLGARPVGAQWSMFHADPRHSGFSAAEAPGSATLAWTFSGSDSIFYSSPVIGADGTIYMGTVTNKVVALRSDGSLLWTFVGNGSFRYSTPAIAADGSVYIGGGDGRLYAVNPTGTLRWTFTTGAPIKTSPNIASDGTIYLGADNGRLYAIRPDSTLVWTYQTGDSIRSSPAVAPDGTIFFGSEDFYFYALWPNGTLRWRAATGNIIKFCSPAVTDSGVVYFGSYDGFLYAMTTAGAFKWAYYTGHVIRSSPAVGRNGIIYVGSDQDLLALNPNGTLRWKYRTSGEIYGSPAYLDGGDGAVCVGSDDGEFHVVDTAIANEGDTTWTYLVGSPIRSSPAPTVTGKLVVADLAGRVWAFGPTSPVSVADDSDGGVAGVRAVPNPSVGAVRFVPVGRDGGERRLLIYDLLGRQVAALSRGSDGGYWWNGLDKDQRRESLGIYFYRLDGLARTGRLVLLR